MNASIRSSTLREPLRNHAKRWQLAACLVVCVVFFVQWEAHGWRFASAGDLSVDAAFVVAMPVLFEHGAHFGPDAIFTYGPWGMLTYNLVPWKYYWLAVVLKSLFACGIGLVIFKTALSRATNRLHPFGVWLMLALIIPLWMGAGRQALWQLPSLYLGTIHVFQSEQDARHTRQWIAMFLSACAAIAGLVKFNVFVFGLGVQIIVLILDLTARRLPIIGMAWLSATLAGWLGAGQSIGDIYPWISSAFDLSAGYSDAMAKGFWTPYPPSTVILFAAGVIAFGVYGLSIVSQASKLRTRVAMLTTLGLCAALAWQHAIGGNQLPSAIGEVLTALFVATGVQRLREHRLNSLGHQFAFATSCIVLLSVVFVVGGGFPLVWWGRYTTKFEGLNKVLNEGLAPQRGEWDAMLASIRKNIPIPFDLHGTADAYPQHTAVIIADPRLTYAPRPAYLSLNAHTVSLARQNAEYLQTRGPENILFDVLPASESVNNRLPATADGPSWPLVWTHYSVLGQTRDFLVMTRRSQPLAFASKPLINGSIGWNNAIALPWAQSKTIWATLKVHPTLLGRIVKAVYKAPQVYIELTLANGVRNYQLVPALGEAGFILSPFVVDNASMVELLCNDIGANEQNTVKSIAIKTEASHEWFWSPTIDMSLSELFVNDGKPVALPDELVRSAAMGHLRQRAGKCIFPPSLDTAPGIDAPITLLHAPCETSLAIVPGTAGIRLSYGLRFIEKDGEPKTDGAGVTIAALDANGQVVKQYSRYLDPAKHSEDRGQQLLTFNWAPATAVKLTIALDAGPNGDPAYDHTYVSEVDFLKAE